MKVELLNHSIAYLLSREITGKIELDITQKSLAKYLECGPVLQNTGSHCHVKILSKVDLEKAHQRSFLNKIPSFESFLP